MSANKDKRVVVVTGGSRGIGAAVCRCFAGCGHAVVINYRSSDAEAAALQEELNSAGWTARLGQADVSDYDQARQMIEGVIDEFDRIDVLVNNAGITRDNLLMLMSTRDWNDVIDTNLTGMFNCSKAVCSHMIGRHQGSIINVSSLSALMPLPGQANYAAAKGGMISFTRTLAAELAPFSIRVNAVAPGVIETDMVRALKPEQRDKFLANIPMRRFGSVGEVASTVKFLASEEASYITGETLSISGGLS